MNKEELNCLIKQYVKNNVRIEVQKEYGGWNDPDYYNIKLIVEDEVISSETLSV